MPGPIGLIHRPRPPSTSFTPVAPVHTVKSGDTLEGISMQVARDRIGRGLTPFKFEELFGVPNRGASALSQPAWAKNKTALQKWDELYAKNQGSPEKTVNEFVKTNIFKQSVLAPWLVSADGYARVIKLQDKIVLKNDIPNPDLIRIGQRIELLTPAEVDKALLGR